MNTIAQAFFDAVLADIVYVDGLTVGMGKDGDPAQISAFRNLIARRITDPIAQEIAARFEVLAVKSDPSSDYQGVVFRDKVSGELYVSHRGTAGATDIFIADFSIAMGTGIATQQSAAMVNWWREISLPATTQYTQVNVVGGAVLTAGATAAATGLVNAALVAAGGPVNVVGHSLGGQLTTLFSALFSPQVARSSTFNGAGLFSLGTQLPGVAAVNALTSVYFGADSALTRLGQVLGVTPNLPAAGSKQRNYFAQNGLSVTTSDVLFTQLGQRIGIYNEEDVTPLIGNHFLYKQTDTLALYRAIEKLNPGVTMEQLNSIAQGSSPDDKYVVNESTLEKLLDGLRRLLQNPNAAATLAGDDGGDWKNGTMPASRIAYQTNLKALTDSQAFKDLAGKVTLNPSNTALGAAARTDFASLLALQVLSPITLKAKLGSETLVETALANVNNSSYIDWLADKALSSAEREAGKAVYSDEWIADRAAMLGWVVTRNQRNTDSINDTGVQGMHYQDMASGIAFDLGLPDNVVDKRQTLFGGGGADTLNGKKLDDHLYGGAGNDVLNGLAGADYLEGNADDDVLDGGAGNDMLLGGKGDDRLEGGANDDTLIGGADVDIYVIVAGEGFDTVLDSDGQGRIRFTISGVECTLNGGRAMLDEPNTWVSTDGRVYYSQIDVGGGRYDLVVTSAQGAFRIQSFTNGALGITLDGAPIASGTDGNFVGDFVKKTNAAGTKFLLDADGNYQRDGDQPGAKDLITGSSNDDLMQGLEGDDALLGRLGDDRVEGGNGNDVLMGGLGGDTLIGGAGNDVIYGSSSGLLDYPTDTNYEPPVPSSVEVFGRGFTWVDESLGLDGDGMPRRYLTYSVSRDKQEGDAGNVIDGGAGQDVIMAGTGADLVRGGDDSDAIFGMADNDTLYGDAGNDRVYGDGPSVADPNLVTSTMSEQHGKDLIAGGEGQDTLLGQGNDDTIFGGTGNDYLYGDDRDATSTPTTAHGYDVLDGGDGNDRMMGGGLDDSLFGGEGNDSLWGDAGAQEVGSQAYISTSIQGSDYLDGEGGDDYLQGEGGADTLFGGTGHDVLIGDDATSRLPSAAHGDDLLSGEDGDDQAFGGGGSDQLFGGAGNDTLDGDDMESGLPGQAHGDDYLDGGEGEDLLYGRGGADTLYGGSGADYLMGDALPSELAAEFNGTDYLDGGDGNDSLFGGGGSDTLRGGAGNDALLGNEGADLLVGGAGADDLRGGAGDDRYVISASETGDGTVSDRITDAEGADRIELEGAALSALQVSCNADGTVVLALGAGQGFVITSGLTSSVQSIESNGESISFQRLVGQTLGSVVFAQSAGEDRRLLGGANEDILYVSHAGNTVAGGRGNDQISLGSGQGSIVAMSGGDGMDHVTAVHRAPPATSADPTPVNVLKLDAEFAAADLRLYKIDAQSYALSLNDRGDGVRFDAVPDALGQIVSGDQPFDIVQIGGDTAVTWQEIAGRGVVVVPSASEGDDVLVLSPTSDVFNGLTGNDSIDGLAGNDALWGDAGNDTLVGGVGDDRLYADTGNDLLIGGAGNDQLFGGDADSYDVLEGGEGNDQYYYRFGYGLNVGGKAIDDSASSNDIYYVRATGYVGGWQTQEWNIADYGGNDQLVFQSSVVTPTNTTVRSIGTGLSLTSWNLTVKLEGAVDAIGNLSAGAMEAVVFQDGTTWTAAQLRSMSQQTTAGNDTVVGFGSNDTIDGGAGADSIDGYGGDDSLLGGAGNDTLRGGTGNDTLDAGPGGGRLFGDAGADTYMVWAGGGDNFLGAGYRVSPVDEGFDVLRIMANPADVTLSIERSGDQASEDDHLLVRWNDGSASVRFELFGTQPGVCDAVEELRFADGSAVNVAQFVNAHAAPATSASDVIELTSLDDSLAAGDGNDTVYGRGGNDSLYGGAGNDYLYGGYGSDHLDGGAGDDYLSMGVGAGDTVAFGNGSGHDTLVGSGGSTEVVLGTSVTASDCHLRWADGRFTSGYDSKGNFSSTTVWDGTFRLSLGTGPDHLDVVFSGGLYLSTSSLPSIRFQDGTKWTAEELAAMANTATSGDDLLFNALGAGSLSGGDGNDTLFALSGASLEGGSGSDSLQGGDGDDRLIGGTGDDSLVGGRGFNTLVYSRGDGNDICRVDNGGQTAIEFTAGISAADVTLIRSSFDLVVKIAGGGSIAFSSIDYANQMPAEIRFADGTIWQAAEVLARALGGGAGSDRIVGTYDRDEIFGAAGDDYLVGSVGSDIVHGDDGSDTLFANDYDSYSSASRYDLDMLIGGAGDDRLYSAYGYVTYRFDLGFGHDTIAYSPSKSGDRLAKASFGEGISPADLVCSRAPNGGLTLWLPTSGDTVEVECFFEAGTDVPSSSYPLGQIEFADGTVWTTTDIVSRLVNAITPAGDVIYGSAAADVIDALGGNDYVEGGAGNDALQGGSGRDWLYGGAGDDTLRGGLGNDYLHDSDGIDRYEYSLGDGTDSIEDLSNTISDLLALGAGIATGDVRVMYDPQSASDGRYRLEFVGSDDSVEIHGIDSVVFNDGTTWSLAYIDAMAKSLYGTSGNDTIGGTTQGDWLFGLAGDDQLNGLAGNDWLDGGTGVDTLKGSTGDDTYVVDNGGDTLSENSNQGNDKVLASVNFTLPTNVESLELTGTAAISGTGNSLANSIVGNSAANTLSGGTGADQMAGRAGDDTYVVDNTGDVLTEEVNQGIDLVQTSVSYTLAANVENLTLTTTSTINGTGNALDNALTGNSANNTLTGLAGNDTLDGGSGNDTMVGGVGNDTYVVNVATDVVTENASEGTDTVQSSVTLTLSSNVENLTLTGTGAINGTGNTLANVLTGNGASNALDGGAGVDTLIGGAGNDTYTVDNAADLITELVNEGTDSVNSSVTYALSANVENLTLAGSNPINGTGNALDNVLTGNSASNVLTGGAGNDTYVVGTGDTVTELSGQGIDTVSSSLTWTLGSDLENLSLTGSGVINGTGNGLDNVLTGNSANNTLTGAAGNDTLDGGAGNDTLVGGTGDDAYFVNVATDVVTENASEGIDTVNSAVTLTLGSNLENLTLTGGSAIDGTGNALANILSGNTAANTLKGAEGNDTYIGGAGNDTLTDSSTTSADIYRWGIGAGNDSISDAGGSDRIEILPGVVSSQVKLTRSGNNLQIGITGATDVLTVLNWYTGTANKIEEIKLSDGTIIGAGAAPLSIVAGNGTGGGIAASASSLVDAMAQFDAAAVGEVPLERRAWFEQPMLAASSM